MATARVTLPLYNLGSTGSEALAIERSIATLPGVTQVYVNPLTEMAYVVYDPAELRPEHLSGRLERLGYGAASTLEQQQSTKEVNPMIEQAAQPSPRRYRWAIPLLVVILLASAAGWFWISATTTTRPQNAPATAMSAGATQTNAEGQVTIAATWQGSGAQTSFNIMMNTHAVDLDGYDLKQLAVLRINGGADTQPINWEAPKGGHHRSGTLTFPATDAKGRTVTLVIRNVAGVPERIFTWQP